MTFQVTTSHQDFATQLTPIEKTLNNDFFSGYKKEFNLLIRSVALSMQSDVFVQVAWVPKGSITEFASQRFITGMRSYMNF